MKLSDSARIPEQVMAREVGEEVVILDLATGTYFGLDSVGARIWYYMSNGSTFTEICDLMAEEFEVSRDELECDVLKLAKDLEARGLITVKA